MQAVILAGGKGSRLKPFTNTIPKPLVPVGDRAILEIILLQLKRAGVSEVIMAVNHMAHLIRAFFGDGKAFGLRIRYSEEKEPLGTAGPLRLIQGLEEHFLVLNGDVLTSIDYGAMYQQHVGAGRCATLATYRKTLAIDLGVLNIADGLLQDYVEKPVKEFIVSMGIYVFHRSVVDQLPEGRFDLPDLVMRLKQTGTPVHCFSGDYYWLDVGRVDDYEKACEIFEQRRSEFLPDERNG